jgi:dolichyl-phosphate beta-glucosyltransferase
MEGDHLSDMPSTCRLGTHEDAHVNGDMSVHYSIIIPAYNEAGRIAETLSDVGAWARRTRASGLDCEVIVVCDGCTDDTESVVRRRHAEPWLRVVSYPDNRGKGYAVRRGVRESLGNVVAFMDADGATPIHELPRLAALIGGGKAVLGEPDLVIGSRRAPGALVFPRQPLSRRLLGQAFSLFNRIVLRTPFMDTQCGFKVFRGELARDLFAELRCDRFGFDVELLTLACQRGCRIREIGVSWHDVPGSKVQPWRDGVEMVRTAWRLRRKRTAGPAAGGPIPNGSATTLATVTGEG